MEEGCQKADKALEGSQLKSSLTKYKQPDKKVLFSFDTSKPNGTPRKVMDITLAKNYGWKSTSKFESTLIETYNFFKKENNDKCI